MFSAINKHIHKIVAVQIATCARLNLSIQVLHKWLLLAMPKDSGSLLYLEALLSQAFFVSFNQFQAAFFAFLDDTFISRLFGLRARTARLQFLLLFATLRCCLGIVSHLGHAARQGESCEP